MAKVSDVASGITGSRNSLPPSLHNVLLVLEEDPEFVASRSTQDLEELAIKLVERGLSFEEFESDLPPKDLIIDLSSLTGSQILEKTAEIPTDNPASEWITSMKIEIPGIPAGPWLYCRFRPDDQRNGGDLPETILSEDGTYKIHEHVPVYWQMKKQVLVGDAPDQQLEPMTLTASKVLEWDQDGFPIILSTNHKYDTNMYPWLSGYQCLRPSGIWRLRLKKSTLYWALRELAARGLLQKYEHSKILWYGSDKAIERLAYEIHRPDLLAT